jgi:hypothetical protein
VFDPAAIRDRATFAQPRQYAEGMRYVAVNGQLVVDGGALTAARPGRALRGPGYRGGGQSPTSPAGAGDASDQAVRRVVDDYVRLYRKDTLPEWRALFLPSFTATSPGRDGAVTVRTLDQFFDAQARGFAQSADMSETLDHVVVSRSGKLATAWADFAFHQNGTSRPGRLALTLIEAGDGWKIASLLFSY